MQRSGHFLMTCRFAALASWAEAGEAGTYSYDASWTGKLAVIIAPGVCP